MRDIIWTIIIVWVLWKIIDSFKSPHKIKATSNNKKQQPNFGKQGETTFDNNSTKNKSHLDPNIGEYVDYEEIK